MLLSNEVNRLEQIFKHTRSGDNKPSVRVKGRKMRPLSFSVFLMPPVYQVQIQ